MDKNLRKYMSCCILDEYEKLHHLSIFLHIYKKCKNLLSIFWITLRKYTNNYISQYIGLYSNLQIFPNLIKSEQF